MTLRQAIIENIKLFITLLLKLSYTISNIFYCASKFSEIYTGRKLGWFQRVYMNCY